ncbi:MAG TPA: hypothetical protein PKA53_10240 [Sphingobacterium sp.]|nr:hypothetical protein [Sphingobacterium sp.]
MKKPLLLTVFLIMIAGNLMGQRYIGGNKAIPFSDVAQSTYLTDSKRISYTDALALVNTFKQFPTEVVLKSNIMTGEYFLHDSIVINLYIAPRSIYFNYPSKSFSETREWHRMIASAGDSRPIETYYFDEIKDFPGYTVFIRYYKNSNKKEFVIQDIMRKYGVTGTIYNAMDQVSTAEAFVDTLLQSIVFKQPYKLQYRPTTLSTKE